MGVSRNAVLEAIAEFKQLGRDEFLSRYGYGRAKSYYVEHGGERFDSKAIYGVAHKYELGGHALKSSEFSGGRGTVAPRLEALGFRITDGS